MKLSSLTTIDKIKLAAELDGWTELENNKSNTGLIGYRYQHKYAKLTGKELIPNYATSYDAIIPLMQKQSFSIICMMAQWLADTHDIDVLCATPSQLLDALLVATGKTEL